MLISRNVFFLARRYLWNKYQHPSIQIMINVCSLGILIATCALALVLSIMAGFEQATYKKMQSIYPDLIIDGNDAYLDPEFIDTFLSRYDTKIDAYTTQSITQALIATQDTLENPSMIIVRGIDSKKESLVSNIASKIKNPNDSSLDKILEENFVLIGSKLAENLHLDIADTAYIVYQKPKKSAYHITFEQYPIVIGGIFTTGIEDFDATLLYCNQNLYDEIYPDNGITHVHIKLKDIRDDKIVCKELQEQLNASVYSWKDLYPTLLSALKLEKWAMFLILILIVCVASMNIISLIFMYVTQKQKDIIILLSMRMSHKNIRKIFLCISILIALPATITGLSLAWIIGTILQYFPCIKLPDNIYDTQYLPIQLELHVFCAILIMTVIISLLASIYATRNIDRIKMVELLKTH